MQKMVKWGSVNTMNNLFFIVVLYNKNFEQSKTCTHLHKINKKYFSNIIILDNSTVSNDVSKNCLSFGWNYISMNGNKGLTSAYNKGIDFIKNHCSYSDTDIVILLDDDTDITNDYIISLEHASFEHNDINIFIPRIVSDTGELISPSRYTPYKNYKLKKLSSVNINNILAINSCLAIRLCIFNDYVYNSNLFLDYVDSQFFYDMRKRNENFYLLDSEIVHSFFMKSNNDYFKEINRMRILKKDYRAFVKDKSFLEKFLYFPRIVFWKIRGFLKYRKISYFFDF